MDLQRKIRAWLPLHKRPDSLQIPSSLNSYESPCLPYWVAEPFKHATAHDTFAPSKQEDGPNRALIQQFTNVGQFPYLIQEHHHQMTSTGLATALALHPVNDDDSQVHNQIGYAKRQLRLVLREARV